MADHFRDGVRIPNPDPIKVPWDFDQTGGDITVQKIFPSYDGVLDRDVHLRYAQRQWKWVRDQFAIQLFQAIEQSKDPVVVSVDEQIIFDYFGHGRDRYKIAARLTPTEIRRLVFAGPDRNFQPFKTSTKIDTSFKARLRFLFKGEICHKDG